MVQALKDQPGRARRSKKGQRGLDVLFCRRDQTGFYVQICGSGQRREGLVRGIAAHIGAEVDRVKRRVQKLQIRAVGVVDEKRNAVGVADFCYFPDRLDVAGVIGRSQVDAARKTAALFGRVGKCFCHIGIRDILRDQGVVSGSDPFGVEAEQNARGNEGLVDVSGGEDPGLFSLGSGAAEIEHRADRKRRALGRIIGVATEDF